MSGDATAALAQRLANVGFAFVPASRTRHFLEERAALHDWHAFAASWDSLPLDQHMADQGRYRRRRHAVYAIDAKGTIERLPHQPHFQALDYNPLNGGVERMFEPVDERLGKGPSARAILGWCADLFGSLAPGVDWRVELHQFRIEAGVFGTGKPTPEGMHRDGVDYVLVLLVHRHNIDSGTTMIGSEAQPMPESEVEAFTDRDVDGFVEPEMEGISGSFTLADPFDVALVDDHRVFHGVTPVRAHDASKPAHRDVLVVTFARMDARTKR